MRDDSDSRNDALRTVAKGAGISFLGLILSNLILYVNRLVLARFLGVDEYGLMYLGVSILTLVMLFAGLELPSAITRYVPFYAAKGDEKRVRGVFMSVIRITIPLSIAAFVIMFFFSDQIATVFFHDIALSNVLKIFSFVLPFFTLYKISEAGLVSFKRMDYCAFSRDFFRPMLTLGLVFALLFYGLGLAGATVSYAIGYVGMSIVAFYILNKKLFPIMKRGGKAVTDTKKMLKYSIPLLLYGVVWSSAIKIDTLFLGAMRSAAEVGIYQTAIPTANFLGMPSLALAGVFLPVVSEMLSKKRMKEIGETYKTVSKWAFYLSFPMFLVLVFFPDAVINTLFGYEYIEAGSILGVLAIGLLVLSFNMFSINILSLFEKTKLMFVNGVVSLGMMAALNYALIPPYGIMGAAVATTISYVFFTALSIAEAYYYCRAHPFHRDIVKAFAAGLASVSLVYYATKYLFPDLNIIILGTMLAAFLALYSLLLLVLRGVGKDDILILKAIEKKTGLRIELLRNVIKRFA